MTLKEKLNEVEATLIGNRISAISSACLLAGAGSMAILGLDQATEVMGPILGPVMGVGLVGCSFTGFGSTMKKLYIRTREHLKKFNTLDPRFFKAMMELDYGSWLLGYGQLQAMYLAARDSGNPEYLRQFHQLKREYTKNIIPNF